MWNLLRTEPIKPWHFRRQVPFGPFYADFASHRARLVVEVDGSQHFTDQAEAHDRRRDAFLASQGYRVLHLTTADVLNHLDAAHAAITAQLAEATPPND